MQSVELLMIKEMALLTEEESRVQKVSFIAILVLIVSADFVMLM
jgi:hypothetical protein